MIPENIKALMQKLLNNRYEAYIIGGAVRDHLLGIEPHDYDIFTNATGEQILSIFPQGKVLGGEERQAKILTVIVDGVEISQYRSNGDRTECGTSLKDHQKTCDFYCNALAKNIDGELCGDKEITKKGIEQIGYKRIEFVGNAKDRLEEDKLRALRFVRFVCKYKFQSYFNTTFDQLDKFNNDLDYLSKTDIIDIPPERIREEFFKILKYDTALEELHKYNLLKQIIPEMYHENNFKSGGQFHGETPFDHMIYAFKEACKVTDNVLLRFACMMHDIGKAYTRTEENDETHFYEHDKVGAEIVTKIMERLKFSNDDITFVQTLVRKHMFGYMDDINDKTYVKFFKELKDKNIDIMDYMVVIYCDRQANMKKDHMKFADFIKSSCSGFLLSNYYRITYDHNKPFSTKDLAIGGKELIDIGIKPGPEIGKILLNIMEKVLDGELENTRESLMWWIKNGK